MTELDINTLNSNGDDASGVVSTEERTENVTGYVFSNALAEQTFDPVREESMFAVRFGDSEDTRTLHHLAIKERNLLAYPLESDLLRKGRLLLPRGPVAYGSTGELVRSIEAHIGRYVVLPDGFGGLVAHYVLFTWLADRSPTTPYLHFIGDYGSGKSRALQVVGDLCYKPLRVGGTASMASVFRILESVGVCTLLMDETDFFRRSEAHQEMMTLLRQGFQRGPGILRCERKDETFEPRDYDVFGPKLIAGRRNFPDPALESRCIRIYMPSAAALGSVPIELPDDYAEAASLLRDKLLQWRFDHFFVPLKQAPPLSVEPRLRQVFQPLAQVISDPASLKRLVAIVEDMQTEATADRHSSREADVLNALIVDAKRLGTDQLRLKRIAEVLDLHPRRVATICRTLGLETGKDRDGTYVHFDPGARADLLTRYGVPLPESQTEAA